MHMQLKRKKYKGLTVSYEVNDKGEFICRSDGIQTPYLNMSTGEYWSTLAEAELAMMDAIDNYLKSIPKTYKELANKLTDSLVWTHYEECHVDHKLLELTLEEFYKYKNK